VLVCVFSWRVYLAYRLAYIHLVFFFLRDRACPAAATSSAEPPVRGAALRFRNTSAVSSKHTYTFSSDRVVVHIAFHTLTQRYLRTPTDTRYCTSDSPPPCLPSSTTRCLALCEVCPRTYHRPSTPELAETLAAGWDMQKSYTNTVRPGECKKCGRILASFIDPSQAFGPDKIIPPSILANAKGLAILTVFKVGFLGSGRFGSGVVVARLSDGTWYVDPMKQYAAWESMQDWGVGAWKVSAADLGQVGSLGNRHGRRRLRWTNRLRDHRLHLHFERCYGSQDLRASGLIDTWW